MSREGALVLMLALALLLICLMALGWWRRTKRDAGLRAPFGEPPAGATLTATFTGLYVATTVHDVPLERLAIKGLGFRSRVSIGVLDTGVTLDLPGTRRVYIPAEAIVSVAQATVAIDRVVERAGETRLTWRIDGETLVDSYFRPQDVSARALAAAIEPLTPTSPTGNPA